jgi:hypothetical protein
MMTRARPWAAMESVSGAQWGDIMRHWHLEQRTSASLHFLPQALERHQSQSSLRRRIAFHFRNKTASALSNSAIW